jgi:hypothetical protein
MMQFCVGVKAAIRRLLGHSVHVPLVLCSHSYNNYLAYTSVGLARYELLSIQLPDLKNIAPPLTRKNLAASQNITRRF